MTDNLVICRFSEQRYMILNMCTFFGTPGRSWVFLSGTVHQENGNNVRYRISALKECSDEHG